MKHRLCSRIRDDQPQGYAAWTGIVSRTVMREYWVIKRSLQSFQTRLSRYLHEFHADSYASHGLHPLPDDRSKTNVHEILKPWQAVPVC